MKHGYPKLVGSRHLTVYRPADLPLALNHAATDLLRQPGAKLEAKQYEFVSMRGCDAKNIGPFPS